MLRSLDRGESIPSHLVRSPGISIRCIEYLCYANFIIDIVLVKKYSIHETVAASVLLLLPVLLSCRSRNLFIVSVSEPGYWVGGCARGCSW